MKISIWIISFFILVTLFVSGSDYRNFYGISWRGTACENIDYAKSMGYDYVFYQRGMESCKNNNNLKFYIEGPEYWTYPSNSRQISFSKHYTTNEIKLYSDLFLWKSNSQFPYNLATGWWFSETTFRPLYDFQRKDIIGLVVKAIVNNISKKENRTTNFTFGGYAWDVPTFEGDLWSGYKPSGGKQVTIKYWTGSGSGYKHPNRVYTYSTYFEGQVAFRKALMLETKKKYPKAKVLVEPWLPYEDYIKLIENRYDAKNLTPDIICQEGSDLKKINNTLKFVLDWRIFNKGLITRSKMCSTTPNSYTHERNLVIAGNAAVNNAWFSWFGRFGGTGEMPNYASIREVPYRLKLIRAMVNWDNLNKATLRKWNSTSKIYTSSHSYADKYVIYTRHPKNKMIYAVVLNNTKAIIRLNKYEQVKQIYRADTLFRRENVNRTNDFSITTYNSVQTLRLKSSANNNLGYIIELK